MAALERMVCAVRLYQKIFSLMNNTMKFKFLFCRVYYIIINIFPSVFVLRGLSKLRKAAVGFLMSVYLSVRVEHLGSHWTDIYKIR